MPQASPKRLHTKDCTAALLFAALLTVCVGSVWYLATRPILNPYAAWRASQSTAALPARLGALRPVYFDVSPDTFQSLLSIGYARHLCGGVLFEMSEVVSRQILEQGIGFFAEALEARGYPTGSTVADRFAYEPWRETPWPSDWYFEGAFAGGFGCMELDRETHAALAAYARAPGSFFSRSAEREVLIVPGRRLILLTMQD
jgi:hypothetical protein